MVGEGLERTNMEVEGEDLVVDIPATVGELFRWNVISHCMSPYRLVFKVRTEKGFWCPLCINRNVILIIIIVFMIRLHV